MKKSVYLKYFINLTFLFLGFVLFLGLPGAFAQQKDAAPAVNKNLRIKILKELDGKTQMIDTTLTAEEFENLKHIPGDLQNLLREVDVLRLNPSGLELPSIRILGPDQKIIEEKIELHRLKKGEFFNLDSTKQIIYLRPNQHLISVSPDSLNKRIIELKEKIKFRVLPTDSARIKRIWLDKEGDGKQIKIHRLNFGTDDTIRLIDNLLLSERPVNIKVTRKVIILDLVKPDQLVLEKTASPQETFVTEDLSINNLKYYPNPNNGRFTLSFKVPRPGDMAIKIYDQVGREIYREDYQYFAGDFQKEIDLLQTKPGVYYLKIIQGDSAYTKKLVVE